MSKLTIIYIILFIMSIFIISIFVPVKYSLKEEDMLDGYICKIEQSTRPYWKIKEIIGDKMSKKQIWLSDQGYRNMSSKEAKEYFAWFKENIPNEMNTLRKAVDKSIVLDYSPESIIPLEKWFLPLRTYTKLSKKQILEDYANAPECILEEMLQTRYAPTLQTIDLAVKVAVYLGEVFVRNDSDLYWDYVKKPKSDVSFNEPVIYGFSPPNMKFQAFFSVFAACIPIYSSSRYGEKGKKSLYEWYVHWLGEKTFIGILNTVFKNICKLWQRGRNKNQLLNEMYNCTGH